MNSHGITPSFNSEQLRTSLTFSVILLDPSSDYFEVNVTVHCIPGKCFQRLDRPGNISSATLGNIQR